MDSNKIKNIVMGNVQNSLKRSLSELEVVYVESQLTKFIKANKNDTSALNKSFPTFMDIVINDLLNPESIHSALSEPAHIDIHEMLKVEILDSSKTKVVATPSTQSDITSILGYSDGFNLQRIINPSSIMSTAYIILDRKHHSNVSFTENDFTWNLAIQGQSFNGNSSAISSAPLKNVVGIRMIPFRFPKSENALTSLKRISILIHELSSHSYVSVDQNRRFHFLFDLTETGTGDSDPYELNDSGQNIAEFDLHSKVQEIQSITLSFGNPFLKFSLDPDRLTANITSVGIQTILTFTQPHKCQVNDHFVISNFSTNNMSADLIIAFFLQFPTGWPASAVTASTVTIDLDISGLAGVIDQPSNIYLEAKRFIIPLHVKFLRSSAEKYYH
jgi:hypothetical protein